MGKITTFKKKAPKRKTKTLSKGFVRAVRNIALGTQETKQAVTTAANHSIFHNGGVVTMGRPQLLIPNLLSTLQGMSDDKGTKQNRIGDCIMPIGIKLMMEFRFPVDRPNTNVKLWVVKTPADHSAIMGSPATLSMNHASFHILLDSVDTEAVTTKMIRTYKPPVSYWQGTNDKSKEITFHRKLWIPMPKTQYVYGGDDTQNGKLFNLAVYVGAYDSYGTLRSDIVSYVTATSVLYFKDG